MTKSHIEALDGLLVCTVLDGCFDGRMLWGVVHLLHLELVQDETVQIAFPTCQDEVFMGLTK